MVAGIESVEEKVEHTLEQYPFVVFERDAVVGYAYAGPLRDREAYQWTTELSVYVDPAAYNEIADLDRLKDVGRAVGKLNKLLPRK